MGFANKAIVAAGLGFAVSALAGCGGGGGHLLSSGQANELSAQLNQASTALYDDNCSAASNAIRNFSNSVNDLGSVDQTLVANLNQGAQKIEDLASKECPVVVHQQTIPTRTTTKSQTTATATNTTPTTSTQTFTETIPTITETITNTTPTTTSTSTTTPTTTTGGSGVGNTTTTGTSTSTVTTTTTVSGGSGVGGDTQTGGPSQGVDQ